MKFLICFNFQFHPRREIVADESDTDQNNSDEKKSDSEQRISDEKSSEVIVEELEDAQDSPQALNRHQEDTQVRDQVVTSIEMQSIEETKQATS